MAAREGKGIQQQDQQQQSHIDQEKKVEGTFLSVYMSFLGAVGLTSDKFNAFQEKIGSENDEELLYQPIEDILNSDEVIDPLEIQPLIEKVKKCFQHIADIERFVRDVMSDEDIPIDKKTKLCDEFTEYASKRRELLNKVKVKIAQISKLIDLSGLAYYDRIVMGHIKNISAINNNIIKAVNGITVKVDNLEKNFNNVIDNKVNTKVINVIEETLRHVDLGLVDAEKENQ